MKYTVSSNIKTPNSTNISKKSGKSIPENNTRKYRLFFVSSLLLTNLISYSLGSLDNIQQSSNIDLSRHTKVILSLILKTPFKTLEQLTLANPRTNMHYHNIYFAQEIQSEEQLSFEEHGRQYIVYAPKKIAQKLMRVKHWLALPHLVTLQKKQSSKKRMSREVIY